MPFVPSSFLLLDVSGVHCERIWQCLAVFLTTLFQTDPDDAHSPACLAAWDAQNGGRRCVGSVVKTQETRPSSDAKFS